MAVCRDYELVVNGLSASLEPYSSRVEVVRFRRHAPVTLDVLLQDPELAVSEHALVGLSDLAIAGFPTLVAFGWSADPTWVERALGQGAVSYLGKGLPADRLVRALEDVASGRHQNLDSDGTPIAHPRQGAPLFGLTGREAEILALIAAGLTNQRIAETLFLSINSIKTYIRAAYRKVGVTSRSQAVAWYLTEGPGAERPRDGESTSGGLTPRLDEYPAWQVGSAQELEHRAVLGAGVTDRAADVAG